MSQDRLGGSLADIRLFAERAVRKKELEAGADLGDLRPDDMRQLLHELRVHQIELEMQNEELRRAEAELETSRAEYFDLYDLAPAGYLTVDESGFIEKANLTSARLFGLDRIALVREPLARFIAAEDQDTYYLHLKALSRTGRQQAFGVRMATAGGARFWARLEIDQANEAEGKSPLCRVVVMDVTELKQAEESLAAAIADLQEADRRKDHFLGVLSHEIRNPLASIILCLSLLERVEPGGEQAATMREIMRRQANQLSRIVDDLLSVTRIVQGKVELRKEDVALSPLVRRTAEDHLAAFHQKGVELKLCSLDAEVLVEGDPVRLAQVVGNLLDNAAKFTDRGGIARLSVTKDVLRQCAVIRLADNGIGISPEVLKSLFVPFRQADTSLDRQGAGLGLGLALVRGLVELHNGKVCAESQGIGKGSVFTVYLPLSTKATSTAKADPGFDLPLQGLRVLVIEDVEDLAESLRYLLSAEGLEVTVAHRGVEGIAKAKQSRPHVLLCDIGLPDLDGYEVAHAFRASEELKDVYMISLSGYTRPEDQQRAREAGFHRQLSKPVELNALKTALAEAQAPPGRDAVSPWLR